MTTLFLDSSCMVSFFITDQHSQKAKAEINKIVRSEIQGLISALSLVELSGVMRRNTDEATARQVKNDVMALAEKGLISIVPIRNLDAYLASDLAISTGLRGADAIIVNAAKQTSSKLLTFDDEIRKKAKSVVEFYDA